MIIRHRLCARCVSPREDAAEDVQYPKLFLPLILSKAALEAPQATPAEAKLALSDVQAWKTAAWYRMGRGLGCLL